MTRKPPPPPPPGTAASGRDRRVHERFEVLAQVQLKAGGEVALVPISNISAGGVLLRLEQGSLPQAAPGDAVSVFIHVDDEASDDLCVDLEAEVIRVGLGGPGESPTIALMWTSQDPATVGSLASVLEALRRRSP